MPEAFVLPKKFSDGPHGLGHPDDKSLRKVEIEVIIPKLIREKAKAEKCVSVVADFHKCCKETSVFMVFKCREENAIMKSCLAEWYRNKEFHQMCTEEYLKQRSEYRKTGIKKPTKRA